MVILALGTFSWLAEINRWEIAMIFSRTLLMSADLGFLLCHLATTQVEAKLCAVEEDTFEVYLYVTIKNEKVSCILNFKFYFKFYFSKTVNKCQVKQCNSCSIEIILIFQSLKLKVARTVYFLLIIFKKYFILFSDGQKLL